MQIASIKSPNVVSIVSIDEHKRILMVSKQGNWILPGGKPVSGESNEETILRELEEELPGSVLKSSLTNSFCHSGVTPNSGRTVTVICHLGKVATPDPIITANEIESAKWFAFDEIPWENRAVLGCLNQGILRKLVQSGHLTC